MTDIEKSIEPDVNRLLKDAQKGDGSAENRLFAKLSERFRSVAGYRLRDEEEVEEVCQNALKTILEKYREIEFDEGFINWAYKVLDNKIRKCFDLRGRSRMREARVEYNDKSPIWKTVGTPLDLKRKLLRCLKKLGGVNSRYARVVMLQFQGYEVDEICGLLAITRNNLYVMLSRSRTRLKQCLATGEVQ